MYIADCKFCRMHAREGNHHFCFQQMFEQLIASTHLYLIRGEVCIYLMRKINEERNGIYERSRINRDKNKKNMQAMKCLYVWLQFKIKIWNN